jgi:hypothetical protein
MRRNLSTAIAALVMFAATVAPVFAIGSPPAWPATGGLANAFQIRPRSMTGFRPTDRFNGFNGGANGITNGEYSSVTRSAHWAKGTITGMRVRLGASGGGTAAENSYQTPTSFAACVEINQNGTLEKIPFTFLSGISHPTLEPGQWVTSDLLPVTIPAKSINQIYHVAGSGYSGTVTATFSDGTNTGTSTCTLSGGGVSVVPWPTNWQTFTSTPTITLSGGGGTGASATCAWGDTQYWIYEWASVSPAAPVPILTESATGGTLTPSTTYYFTVAYVKGGTVDAYACTEQTQASGPQSTCKITVASPPPMFNATAYNVYAGLTTGSELLQNSSPVPIGINYAFTTLATGTAATPASWANTGTEPRIIYSRALWSNYGEQSTFSSSGQGSGQDLTIPGTSTMGNGLTFNPVGTASYYSSVLYSPSSVGLVPLVLTNDITTPSVCMLGDSIPQGTGQTGSLSDYQETNYFDYAFGTGLSHAAYTENISYPGETLHDLARNEQTLTAWYSGSNTTYATSKNRIEMASEADYIISELGINDAGGAGGVTEMEADDTLLETALGTNGARIYRMTLTPKDNSTDGWQTLTNQSGAVSGRTTFNDWVRTNPLHLYGIIDVAASTESSLDSGKWAIPSTIVSSTCTTGYASGQTTPTLTDTTQSWTPGAEVGWMVWVPTDSGCAKVVTANTATTLTLYEVSGTTATVSNGAAYQLYNGLTVDGTHPSPYCSKNVIAPLIPVSSMTTFP